MNAVFAADSVNALRRNERRSFLLGLTASCGVHLVALGTALLIYAERYATPPVVTLAAPVVARMVVHEPADATLPLAPHRPAAAPVARAEPKPARLRQPMLPTPPAAEEARAVARESHAERTDSEPVNAEPLPRGAPEAATSAPSSDTLHGTGDPIVPPSFNAEYLDNPAPIYPPAARRLHEQGRVLLLVEVAPDGMPRQVNLATSSGSPRLDEAALAAVRRWRFVPARKGSSAVPAQVLVPIVFGLTG
jgi:periplasmic protein TonB